MQVFGPNELTEDVIQPGFCVGCGACVNLCPYFHTYKGKTAMLFPCTRETGRCHAFCPKIEVDLDELSKAFFGAPYSGEPLGEFLEIYMARAGDAGKTSNCQDGGTVSSLMQFALKTGVIDAAVLTGKDGMVPAPGLATDAKEVTGFASSKYTAAPSLAALNEGVNRGFSRMGLVGTPCQITAAAQMKTNPTDAENFTDRVAITIGLFCTWAIDTRKFLSFIKANFPNENIGKMKIPPPPAAVMILETDSGKIEIPLEQIRPMVPSGCTICPDMTAEWADISVGAMEGFDNRNTLIVRSKKGQELIQDAVKAGFLILEDFPEESLQHLQYAAAGKKKRAFEKAGQLNLVNTGQGRRSALRVNNKTLEKMISEQEAVK
ncbi:MAG: Coenzyme F420 hydrogenase/dehydrogenase, beta subunit C-terminal domain [Desulfobacterales bacterium]